MIQIPFPNVLERRPNFLMLGFLDDPSIIGYNILVADTLNRAYGAFNGVPGGPGPQEIFDTAKYEMVRRGEQRITSTILRRGNIFATDVTRGQTRVIYDPNELIGTVTNAPPDDHVAYIRVQVATVANPPPFPAPDNTNMSDILIVPSFGYNNVPRPSLPLYGTAPLLATAVLGQPPPSEAMVFHVPNFADAIDLKNLGPGNLFYSVGRGLPMAVIPTGQNLSLASGMKDELILCSDASNPVFSVVISTVAGGR